MEEADEIKSAAADICPTQNQDTATPLLVIDKLTRLTRSPDKVSQEQYITDTDLAFSRLALVVKAGLGKGKTSALIRHFHTHL